MNFKSKIQSKSKLLLIRVGAANKGIHIGFSEPIEDSSMDYTEQTTERFPLSFSTTDHILESVETSAQSIALDLDISRFKKLKTNHENKSGYVLVAPKSDKPLKPKTKDERKGYQLLTTKLKINARPLCSILPTANKVVTTKDWRVFASN